MVAEVERQSMVTGNDATHLLMPGDNVCFIHIPKTGGTTLTSILESKFDYQQICPAAYWEDFQHIAPETLDSYRLFRGHFPYTIVEQIPGHTVCLTMLRDPVERVISAYHFMKDCVVVYPQDQEIQEKARSLSLDDYIQDPEIDDNFNTQTCQLAGIELTSVDDRKVNSVLLETAKKNVDAFSFVGITEEFGRSIALLSYRFGWPLPPEIQRLMVGKKTQTRSHVSAQTIEKIIQNNQLDIELYAYAKARFEQQYRQMIRALMARFRDSVSDHAVSESVAREAITPEAIAPELPHQLLAQQYRSCFRQRSQSAPTRRLLLTFDRAIPGTGWHRLEGLERNEPFRWTGPGTVSTLDFPLDLQDDLAIEFRILHSTSPEILQSLRMTANDCPLTLIPLHQDDSGAIFRCIIPNAVQRPEQPFTRLAFHVDRTIPFNTVDPSSDDKRKVGLAVSLVQIFPLDALPDVALINSPIDSPPWFEAIAFIRHHIQPGQDVFAPNAFRMILPGHLPEYHTDTIDLTINYGARTLGDRAYDWVILHKGVNDDYVGRLLLQILLRRLNPVFANSVFVVFAKASPLPHLGYRSTNVRPVFAGYLKYQIQRMLGLQS